MLAGHALQRVQSALDKATYVRGGKAPVPPTARQEGYGAPSSSVIAASSYAYGMSQQILNAERDVGKQEGAMAHRLGLQKVSARKQRS